MFDLKESDLPEPERMAFGATMRWNAYCRRELRRMRKERWK